MCRHVYTMLGVFLNTSIIRPDCISYPAKWCFKKEQQQTIINSAESLTKSRITVHLDLKSSSGKRMLR